MLAKETPVSNNTTVQHEQYPRIQVHPITIPSTKPQNVCGFWWRELHFVLEGVQATGPSCPSSRPEVQRLAGVPGTPDSSQMSQ